MLIIKFIRRISAFQYGLTCNSEVMVPLVLIEHPNQLEELENSLTTQSVSIEKTLKSLWITSQESVLTEASHLSANEVAVAILSDNKCRSGMFNLAILMRKNPNGRLQQQVLFFRLNFFFLDSLVHLKQVFRSGLEFFFRNWKEIGKMYLLRCTD